LDRRESAVDACASWSCSVTLARRAPDRYGAGSVALPFTRVSKWTCGPLLLPVLPT
jgi:hypothetical protein